MFLAFYIHVFNANFYIFCTFLASIVYDCCHINKVELPKTCQIMCLLPRVEYLLAPTYILFKKKSPFLFYFSHQEQRCTELLGPP